jgi:hypothetical protein
MNGMVIDFPKQADEAIRDVAVSRGLRVLKETHYEAINRELIYIKGKRVYRMDVNYDSAKAILVCTGYLDEYPNTFARMIRQYFSFLPERQPSSKTVWHKLGELPLGLTKDEYRSVLEYYVDQTKRIT